MNSRHHQTDDSPDGTHAGYFVVGDISGYTAFLMNNEPAHVEATTARAAPRPAKISENAQRDVSDMRSTLYKA